MSKEPIADRPTPISLESPAIPFKRGTDIPETLEALRAGKQVLITEFYSNGLDLLHALRASIKSQFPGSSFQEQRSFRGEYQKLSQLVLLEVKRHALTVKRSPDIGWLAKLYPELDQFRLPFPQIQGLNSAWQWYQNGISIPGLRNKIHPYYGTYFPTRFEHVTMFDRWLSRYQGAKKTAIDVGIGSGVLALLMIKAGFQKVFGTDTNPNAIIGLHESFEGTKLSRKIELDYGHLFGKWEKPTELIVFNPPWLPISAEANRLDEAIYYPETLFPDFFAEAKTHLLPDGKLVLLFSNLAQLTDASATHPIEVELAEGGRFKLDFSLKKSVQKASEKTTRNITTRASEEVELWVLTHK
ncbi:MAG: methyltransferase [Bacteroidia bacterium]|nr:methyltransferase [Bacteroidia bacterium]